MAGRKPYAPTEKDRKTVRAMTAYGIQQDRIASVLMIAPKTLRRHFRYELDNAATEANAQMAASLYQKGLGGDTIAMIFWLKVRAGWNDRQTVEVSGVGGAAIDVQYSWAEAEQPKLPAPAKLVA